MAKFSASSSSLILALLVCISVTSNVLPFVGGCNVAVVGGGCPNVEACQVTCANCYRGIGHVVGYCRAAGGGIPYESCVCAIFSRGIPCPPPGPPRCPSP